MAFGTLPSMITAALVPEFKVSKQVFILGIIPPVMILLLIIFSIRFFERVKTSFLFLSKTPGTSVKRRILSAFNALAIDPAAVSAFILKVSPFAP